MLVNSTDWHKNSGAEIKYFLMDKKKNIDDDGDRNKTITAAQ